MKSDEYKLWFDKSDENIKWATDNFQESNHELVCFLSQQAVELVLKGYIYSKDVIFPKTHNLSRLLEICKSLGLKTDKHLEKEIDGLSEFYF